MTAAGERTIEFVDTTTARRQPEPVERHRADHARRAGDRADDGPRRLPRARLHLEHAHGGVGPLPPRGPVGADPARSSAAMPNTPLSMITTGMRFISWVPADEDVMRARVPARRAQRDPPDADRRPVERPGPPEAPRRDGARGGHRGGRDRPHLLDQRRPHPRVLRAARRDPRRLRRHGPAVPEGPGRAADARRGAGARARTSRRAAGERTIELHSHCTIGLAPLVYLEGVRAGFEVVHTASGALSRGTSQPEVLSTVRNLEAIGYEIRSRSRRAGRCVRALRSARAGQGPAGRRAAEFDAVYYTPPAPRRDGHAPRAGCSRSCAGRSCSTPCSTRSPASAPRWATRSWSRPVSQFIASQAARNVIDGERWANVSDETIRYFLGHYGEPPAPVDPEIADRVLARPQAEQAAATCSRSASTARVSGSGGGSPRRSCCCG